MTTFLAIALILGAFLVLWVAWIEPRRFRIRRFDVQLPNLNAPLKAVVIGDIQPNIYHWPAHRLHSVFAKIGEDETPDVTLWLGDYYNGHTGASGDFLHKRPRVKAFVEARLTGMDDISAAMGMISGRLGSFAVLGNHDWAWSGEETTQHLQAQGITVLQDAVADIFDETHGHTLQIVGYEDLSSDRLPNYLEVHNSLNNKAAQIALSHSPDAFPEALGGPALMLAGHTHGGQIRLPFLGAVVLPIKYPHYDRGWFAERHRRLFVTTGLGSSLPPFRFLCPPEVVILNLIPSEAEA